jgi:hypothetical protein
VTVVGLSYASSIIGELVPKGLALSRVAVSGVARRKSVDEVVDGVEEVRDFA